MDKHGNVRSYNKEDIKNKPWVKRFIKKYDKKDSSINIENLACMVYIIRENHKCKPDKVYKSNDWLNIIKEEDDSKKG